MDYRNLCQNCGADLRKVDDTHYACVCCNTTYSTEKIDSYAKKVDDTKRELISNARKNLYAAISEKYISAEAVHNSCVEIKKYLPDDYQANFYEDFITNSATDIAKLIRKIDVKENFESIELMLTFLIKSLEQEFILDVAALIERAYKSPDSQNLIKYHEYETKLSIEAQKINDGIYNVNLPRDVFVAYSSADMEKVLELVDELENEQGLDCFISVRNLRQGAGSRENYTEDLQTAMDNCKSFVFVSSTNSRRQSCDALRIELPYVKKKDIERSVGSGNLTYEEISHNLKKPRVEYRLEESKHENAADRIVDEFFSGYQRVYNPVDVAERVMRQTTPMKVEAEQEPKSKKPTPEKPAAKKVKFCVSCLSKCDDNIEQCDVCGETNFASSLNEAKRLQKEEKERQKKKEAIQKNKEKEKNKEKKKKENKEKKNKKNKKTKKEVKPKDPQEPNEPRESSGGSKVAFVFTWIVAIVAIAVLVGLSFILADYRQWFIASAIGIAYVAVMRSLERSCKLGGYIFFGVCMSLASMVLVHFSGMIPYVLCFSVALIISMIVSLKKFVPKFVVASYTFAFIGAILLFISIGTNYTCLTKALVVGCGIAVTFIAFGVIARIKGAIFYETPLVCFWVILGILFFILMWRNYFFTIFAICALAGIMVSGFIGGDEVADGVGYGIGGYGIVMLILALFNLWLFEPKAGNEMVIDKGILKTYAGSQEVVVIPQEVTSIHNNAFYYLEPQNNLKEVVLHNKITSIGKSAFIDCDALETVTIPSSVKTVNKKAFSGCDNLKTVTLEQGVDSIEKKAFYKCKNLETITIPGSVTTVGKLAFSCCDSLKSVTFEQGVTTIDEKAFYKCRNIEEIIIPSSVTSIGDAAFRECNNLSKIYYAGSEADWQKITKDWWISTGDDYVDYEIVYNFVSNNPVEQYNAGLAYYNGNGVTQDYAEAVKWFQLSAEQGNASAQNHLGVCYKNGKGVEQDYAEAVKWYKLAAEQGNASAQNNLGFCYEHGEGVEQDYAEALKWYKLAVEQNNVSAQYNLGMCYYYGDGVTRDYAEAVRLFKLAAKQKHSKAQFYLGCCYENGYGTEVDIAKALEYYKLAADEGHQKAQEAYDRLSSIS